MTTPDRAAHPGFDGLVVVEPLAPGTVAAKLSHDAPGHVATGLAPPSLRLDAPGDAVASDPWHVGGGFPDAEPAASVSTKPEPFLQRLASPRQQASLGALALSWLAASALLVRWWITAAHPTSVVGMLVNSALLGFEYIGLPLWWLFFVLRMRRPSSALVHTDLRVAMVVTKAPSEPWEMVRETLQAMRRQIFPGVFDIWLADEKPDERTTAWCRQRGIRISTRLGRADYHRERWPRRTRCKEGNLAFFYDHWGYRDYDVVAQLDADHAPEPSYLRHIVAPFIDHRIGYVAAPSICDRNADVSWSARARVYAEASLHGPIQAGANGCAPLCIGSHYAVRTRALKEIGGLGPDLAEDFSTTLALNAAGWEGAFAIDAEAHGDGPLTLADCLVQEFQWSRSIMNILLKETHRHWRHLRLGVKVRLGFAQLWYPMFALFMLAGMVLPAYAVATDTAFVRISLGSFVLHALAPVAVLVVINAWLRRGGWFRPRNAKVLSWEFAIFQVVRWPWVLAGCAHAIVTWVANTEPHFRVTPKGPRHGQSVSARLVLPFVGFALVNALPVLLRTHFDQASGYRTLALINAAAYSSLACAVIALHVSETPRRTRGHVTRHAWGPILTAAVASAVVIRSIAGGPIAIFPRHPPVAWPINHSRLGSVDLGVTTDALAQNETFPWTKAALQEVNRFEQHARQHASIVMWFSDWAHGSFDFAQVNAVAARESRPQITWEPWDHTRGIHHYQPDYSLASIINGRHDAYIRAWALDAKRWGKPLLLRLAQEMNGNWYPWSEARKYHSRPGQYVQMWRHVHDIFTAVGAVNVRWVWSPVTVRLRPVEYPGSRYVDVVGISGFNGGAALNWSGWKSFASIFDPYLAQLHALAPGKPIQLSEVSSAEAGGSKAEWIKGMFADLKHHPEVRSVIWFNLPKETRWQIESSPTAQTAFADGASERRYK